MKITAVRFGMLRAPLRTPFKTALRTVEQVEDVVFMIDTDSDHVGYGSAPATEAITGDTHSSIVAALRNHIAPRLLGQDIADLDHVTALIQGAVAGNGNAKAAAEIAAHDLWGQLHGEPLYKLLGGGTPRLTTDITISVDTIDKMVADAIDAVERGFVALKVKLGKDADEDIARCKAIHSAVSNHALLRLDANQGWTATQAVHVLRTLEAAGIEPELIEQPVKANDLTGLKYVCEHVHTPVMADESVFDAEQALRLIDMRAADIVNIKLMKAGGISPALQIADVCERHETECMIGCMLESSIGVSAAVHLAVARSTVIRKVDLDVPMLCHFDPVHGNVRFDGAAIEIDDAPGLGIRSIEGLQPLPPHLA
ncbi:dipeptide epimerase [Thermomonas sp. HDW16]|uniref:dipeptide epimerase n=1 Tax=Thermomonas sp. HDW16 TaxID=2714945 RepID=UPI0014097A91|nr:dipeptide epimerase [Thermomonas sp. HDW16]QIL20952.1 dipeptide epimerase [Thermomonas sp. HDW16]